VCGKFSNLGVCVCVCVCWCCVNDSRQFSVCVFLVGLHTECPGNVRLGKGDTKSTFCFHRWGSGFFRDSTVGGIFMASNVSDSCAVWDVCIRDLPHMVGRFGDIEHLRGLIGSGETMEGNTMYWITDGTPHEALPLKEATTRQYFRIVTSDVSGWFAKHSTENRLGIKPACPILEIDKFAD